MCLITGSPTAYFTIGIAIAAIVVLLIIAYLGFRLYRLNHKRETIEVTALNQATGKEEGSMHSSAHSIYDEIGMYEPTTANRTQPKAPYMFLASELNVYDEYNAQSAGQNKDEPNQPYPGLKVMSLPSDLDAVGIRNSPSLEEETYVDMLPNELEVRADITNMRACMER